MKKIYVNPQSKVVKIALVQMIAISDGKLDSKQNITSSDGFGSRRGGTWDDDEEDE